MRQAQPIDRPAAPHTGPPRIKRADDLHRRVSPAFGGTPYETFVSCGKTRRGASLRARIPDGGFRLADVLAHGSHI